MSTYYSQNDEEKHIVEFYASLPPVPRRFLDIGAYDGKTFSNTLRLAELGWEGVCVEPSPIPFTKLMETHRERPAIKLVHAAVTPDMSALFRPFWDSGGDGLSTTVTSHMKKWHDTKFSEFWTVMLPIQALLAQFGVGYDFINLDVESANIELFRAIPWNVFSKLSMVCIEHDNHDQEMFSVLGPLGFEQIAYNGENIVLRRRL